MKKINLIKKKKNSEGLILKFDLKIHYIFIWIQDILSNFIFIPNKKFSGSRLETF